MFKVVIVCEFIFVVDDEVDLCELLEIFLCCMGYDVVFVSGLVEVCEVFFCQCFVFVLIDMCLGDGLGIEFVCQFFVMVDCILVVVIIVYGSVENVVEVFKVGVFDYIVKLFLLDQLCSFVFNVLGCQ